MFYIKNNIIVINFNSCNRILFIKLCCIITWIYWALFSLITPVTNWDSNAYTIARLQIHLRGGLFNNPYYNDARQSTMAWVYDVVHLPFEILNFGQALPNFICLTGILIITYKLISKYYNVNCAWITTASILALQSVVYQAAGTKPDIGAVFFIFCWFYCMEKINEHKFFYSILAAISLSMMFGSRPMAALLLPFLGLYSLWKLRSDKRNVIYFIIASVVSLILWGGTETFIYNYNYSGKFIDATNAKNTNINIDGIGGAVATTVRFLFQNITTGYESFSNIDPRLNIFWVDLCKKTLNFLDVPNKGYQPSTLIPLNDTNLNFLRNGTENSCDYGPIGFLALWTSLICTLMLWKYKSKIWKLSAFSIFNIFLISYFVSWGIWADRYILTSVIISSISLGVIIETKCNNIIKSIYGMILFASLVLTPITSFNHKPSDLVQSICDRDHYQVLENERIYQIINDVKSLSITGTTKTILLIAGTDSWILPFYHIKGIKTYPANGQFSKPSTIVNPKTDYILVLNTELNKAEIEKLKLLRVYGGNGGFWGRNSYLYKSN